MDLIRKAPKTGLVLSGGGARGAYEAGVIKYLREEMPARIKAHIRFEIICGTSVGAVNCCFLAGHAHLPDLQGQILTEVWQKMHIEAIYKIGLNEILNLPKFMFGSRGFGNIDEGSGPNRLGGLFNTAPLEQLVHQGMRWKNITANIASGDLKALAVNATHISSGKTHVFVQREGGGLPPWSTDPEIDAFAVEIGPQHALASAAIPWIFPSVEIDGQAYCDGGLKLNTPISPALRLGADRLVVIGLRSHQPTPLPESANPSLLPPPSVEQFPSALFLLGKILNALMLDKTEYDLKRLERFNALLEVGEKSFGAQFHDTLNRKMESLRGTPYRSVDTLVIRPSVDLAQIAGHLLQHGTIASRAGGIMGPFLRRMADVEEGQVSDLISYLLFDGEFASELIQLGMRDADSQRQQIIEFFSAF